MDKIKTLYCISGPGRLHINKVAEHMGFLNNFKVVFVTGAIPNPILGYVFSLLFGKIVYRRKDIHKRIKLRIPHGFSRADVKDILLPDVILFLNSILEKIGIPSNNLLISFAYSTFSLQACRYLKKGDVLYIRAGTGRYLIPKAKSLSIPVIVDYSSEHPISIVNNLKSAGLDLKPYNKIKSLWDQAKRDLINADCISVNSNHVLDSLVENNINESKIFVNRLPISVGSHYKECYSIKNNKVKLAFSGRFCNWKGASVILDACIDLHKSGTNVSLSIFGHIDNEVINSFAFQYALNSGILVVYGVVSQDELFYRLKESDLYVFLSASEGAASSVLEAKSIGLPVICTESSGADIINGFDGAIIESSSRELKFCIKDLIFNENKRKYIGVNARIKTNNLNSIDNYIKGLKIMMETQNCV